MQTTTGRRARGHRGHEHGEAARPRPDGVLPDRRRLGVLQARRHRRLRVPAAGDVLHGGRARRPSTVPSRRSIGCRAPSSTSSGARRSSSSRARRIGPRSTPAGRRPRLEAAYSRRPARLRDSSQAAGVRPRRGRCRPAGRQRRLRRADEETRHDARRGRASSSRSRLRLAFLLAALALRALAAASACGARARATCRSRSRCSPPGRCSPSCSPATTSRDYIDVQQLGPLVLSLAGVAMTLAAFWWLQRYLARRLPQPARPQGRVSVLRLPDARRRALRGLRPHR